MASRWVFDNFVTVPVGGKIPQIKQPHGLAVFAYKFGWDVDEIRLLTKIFHVGYHLPIAREFVGFEDVVPESHKRTHPGPIDYLIAIFGLSGRVQAIGTIIPNAVMNQGATGVSPLAGERRRIDNPNAVGFQRKRILII